MTSLYQQLVMSYDAAAAAAAAEEAESTTAESLERAEQQRDPVQLASHIDCDPLQLQLLQDRDSLHQRDTMQLQQQRRAAEQREQMQLYQQRDKEQFLQTRDNVQSQHQQQQREHIHQLQSINNLLLDLPPSSNKTSHSVRPYESSDYTPLFNKGSNSEADMSISDLLGLGLPRGSLMGSQSSIGSPCYRQQHNGQNHGRSSSSRQNYPYCEEGRGGGYCSNNSPPGLDIPSTPTSVTTPGSPSTPCSSIYSNPYSYSNNTGNSSTSSTSSNGFSAQSPPPNRSYYNVNNCPSSPGYNHYYGRPIRGSPAYSDCSSPSMEYPHVFGFGGSRSNSPSDSEMSGYNSVDSSLSDIMVRRNCLTMNSSGYSCYSPSMTIMPYDADLYHGGNRAAAYQRMAAKKYQQQQHSNVRHHHCCSSSVAPNIMEPYISLDRAARCHRNAAARSEASCIWSGELPKRTIKSSGFSSKVFLGGLPYDVTESLLVSTFKHIGPIRVEWPGKEQSDPKGYAYIIFESEKQVKALLSCCTHRFNDEKSWYYKITPKRSKPKDAQVIPWHISDSNYSKSSSQKLDPEKTVFVGALHGMLTAEGLAKIMNELFEEVIYAGIDTDKYKYPIGSARVTFSSKRSYKRACATAFVEIKTPLFTKKVQIDPYIEDSVCSACAVQHGAYFCREPICSRYFCFSCWLWQHASEPMSHHQPMSRGFKTNSVVPLGYHQRTNFGNRLCLPPI
ncbi:cytoplasmic polyadenylation element-binding protein 1-A isoform X2 [Venturia canescens]|uniref:cytoplasmic polyadenylation element-binding protein 1-A isoform X2 n=1 Tax=Venturia canescens TaxID=32260 RepID=UPI001C9C01E0|nr:cytoplasmic polyadenylation element-binding protein 1-A isoform X2 [Venturia canescens]